MAGLSTQSHPRQSPYGEFIYPVLSRRSGGVSLGINLNPDGRCNFHCVYCQVDRSQPKPARKPTLEQILQEVSAYLALPNPFAPHLLKDIAIAGDGEPTLFSQLPELLDGLGQIAKDLQKNQIKVILYTNGIGLKGESLLNALERHTQRGGEVWLKLDFWDDASYHRVNQAAFPMEKLLGQALVAGQRFPVVIQACFFWDSRQPASLDWVEDYGRQLQGLLNQGMQISKLLSYTLARAPAQDWAQPYSNEQMEGIATRLQPFLVATGIELQTTYQA